MFTQKLKNERLQFAYYNRQKISISLLLDKDLEKAPTVALFRYWGYSSRYYGGRDHLVPMWLGSDLWFRVILAGTCCWFFLRIFFQVLSFCCWGELFGYKCFILFYFFVSFQWRSFWFLQWTDDSSKGKTLER